MERYGISHSKGLMVWYRYGIQGGGNIIPIQRYGMGFQGDILYDGIFLGSPISPIQSHHVMTRITTRMWLPIRLPIWLQQRSAYFLLGACCCSHIGNHIGSHTGSHILLIILVIIQRDGMGPSVIGYPKDIPSHGTS